MPEPVPCPDCGLGAVQENDVCTVCGLSWDDLKAAEIHFKADVLDHWVSSDIEEDPYVEIATCQRCGGYADPLRHKHCPSCGPDGYLG